MQGSLFQNEGICVKMEVIVSKWRYLCKNEGIYVPLGAKHRLSNPEKEPLVLIEVQIGSYLGEDDIIRFEDLYGR